MIELAWFVAGVVVAFVCLRTWRRPNPSVPAATAVPTGSAGREGPDLAEVRASEQPGAGSAMAASGPAPAPVATATDEAPPAPRPLAPAAIAVDSRQLALSLADELANLACGVEGRAHHLIETAADRTGLPRAAEALLASVQRLRTLHNKLAAFGHAARPARGATTTAIQPLIARLRDELQTLQLGLELRWEPPQHLPEIAIAADVAHDALLFLCGAMLRAERGATHLSIACETCFANEEPSVQLELVLEWITEGNAPAVALLDDPTFTLDLEAANQLVAGHGGELTIHHLPGRAVRAVVRWPLGQPELVAADLVEGFRPVPIPQPAEPVRGRAEHRYGGALVLESDPAVRAMLANELKSAGRAVFACADTTSARTFLEATPDRFELLIVDHPQRLDGGDALAATIRAVAPGLKIFVLSAGPHAASESLPGLHHIQKPFGVHELRHALASVLAAG